MEHNTVRLKAANVSDIGRNPARTKNEDYFGHYEGEYGNLFLVCDGMGGHEAGEVASRLAIEAIKNYFSTNYLPGEENAIIGQAIDFAQQKIIEAVQNDPSLNSMGTTLVLLLVNGSNFWYAHSGDSRIYLSRGGAINQLTKDHSEVQMMVDSGIITLEQASEHPRRNFITKAIGHTNYLPNIEGPRILQQDDVFLLCSDGLTEYVKDPELLQQMEEEPSIACRNLVEMANDRGGSDNITIQIVRVLQCSPFTVSQAVPAKPPKKLLPPLAVIATLLIFAGAVFWYTQSLGDKPAGNKAPTAKKGKPAQKAETPSGASTAGQTAFLSQIDQKLKATQPDQKTNAFFQSITKEKGLAKTLKFFSGEGDAVAYIVPGQTVYFNYEKLATVKGYNISWEYAYAILTLAVVQSGKQAPLTKENWQQELFKVGGTDLFQDTEAVQKAEALYRGSNAANATENSKYLFGSWKSKYAANLKAGNYSLSYTP